MLANKYKNMLNDKLRGQTMSEMMNKGFIRGDKGGMLMGGISMKGKKKEEKDMIRLNKEILKESEKGIKLLKKDLKELKKAGDKSSYNNVLNSLKDEAERNKKAREYLGMKAKKVIIPKEIKKEKMARVRSFIKKNKPKEEIKNVGVMLNNKIVDIPESILKELEDIKKNFIDEKKKKMEYVRSFKKKTKPKLESEEGTNSIKSKIKRPLPQIPKKKKPLPELPKKKRPLPRIPKTKEEILDETLNELEDKFLEEGYDELQLNEKQREEILKETLDKIEDKFLDEAFDESQINLKEKNELNDILKESLDELEDKLLEEGYNEMELNEKQRNEILDEAIEKIKEKKINKLVNKGRGKRGRPKKVLGSGMKKIKGGLLPLLLPLLIDQLI
jgi:hypothetical protein